jgi:PAS domain-containing protein
MSSKQDSVERDLSFYVPEALFDTRADAIVATDHEGIMRIRNAGAVRIFGFAASEVLDRSLDIIVSAKYLASQKGDASQISYTAIWTVQPRELLTQYWRYENAGR